LLREERWAAAYLLAVHAIEEVGKSTTILLILCMPAALRSGAWKAFVSHRYKNALASFDEFADRGARTLEDFGPMIDPTGVETAKTERGKQVATYVHCVGAGTWTEPVSAVSADVARWMVGNAERRVRSGLPWPAERLRIWTAHMAPAVLSRDSGVAHRAAVSAYEEMRDAGLVDDDAVERMRQLHGAAKESGRSVS
jgi:AbiV family abortive infection protein